VERNPRLLAARPASRSAAARPGKGASRRRWHSPLHHGQSDTAPVARLSPPSAGLVGVVVWSSSRPDSVRRPPPPPPSRTYASRAGDFGGHREERSGQPVQGAVVTISKPGDTGLRSPVFAADRRADGHYPIPNRCSARRRGLHLHGELRQPRRIRNPAAPPTVNQPLIDLNRGDRGALKPDQAFANCVKLDLSKPFYPIGVLPQPGSVFYISNTELLSKPGAKGRLYVARTHSRRTKQP